MSEDLTRLIAVARLSVRRTVRSKLFILTLFATALMILGSVEFVLFGPRFRMVQELAKSTALLGATVLALVGGTAAVRVQRENKTLDTMLTKPISRTLFLLADYAGTSIVLALYVVLSFLLSIAAIALKASESNPSEPWRPSIVAASFLFIFLTGSVLAAVSTTLSLVFSRTANFFTSFAILGAFYALPSIAPSLGEFQLVPLMGLLDNMIPESADICFAFLSLASLYAALLSSTAIFTGAWLFERQETSTR